MRKKINITMQVTYEVTKECEVDGDVLESLEYIQENYPKRVDSYIADVDKGATVGYEWIVDNCNENKCVYWEAEIQDLVVEDLL